jgi:hypothetical protein
MTERKAGATATARATEGPSTPFGAKSAANFAQDDSFCFSADEKQQQVLRLIVAQKARQTLLRMTAHL